MLCQVYPLLYSFKLYNFNSFSLKIYRLRIWFYLPRFTFILLYCVMIYVAWMLPCRGRDKSQVRRVTGKTKRAGIRIPSLTWLWANLTFRLDSSTLWQMFGHLFGYFRWLGLTSRVLLDLGLFSDCDFVLWFPLWSHCTIFAACLQACRFQSRRQVKEGSARLGQGHPPSVPSNWRKKFFLDCASGAVRLLFFSFKAFTFLLSSLLKLG